jgi:hypothetical protein
MTANLIPGERQFITLVTSGHNIGRLRHTIDERVKHPLRMNRKIYKLPRSHSKWRLKPLALFTWAGRHNRHINSQQ